MPAALRADMVMQSAPPTPGTYTHNPYATMLMPASPAACIPSPAKAHGSGDCPCPTCVAMRTGAVLNVGGGVASISLASSDGPLSSEGAPGAPGAPTPPPAAPLHARHQPPLMTGGSLGVVALPAAQPRTAAAGDCYAPGPASAPPPPLPPPSRRGVFASPHLRAATGAGSQPPQPLQHSHSQQQQGQTAAGGAGGDNGAGLEAVSIAIVNFKFGSREFASAFAVSPGDAAVVEWDGATHHIGLVAEVRPLARGAQAPALPGLSLIRHAAEADLQEFQRSRFCEPPTVQEAQRISDQMVGGSGGGAGGGASGEAPGSPAPGGLRLAAPLKIVDAEWQLDKTAVTLLLAFNGAVADLDSLHAALAERFGCTVWFLTTPVTGDHQHLNACY